MSDHDDYEARERAGDREHAFRFDYQMSRPTPHHCCGHFELAQDETGLALIHADERGFYITDSEGDNMQYIRRCPWCGSDLRTPEFDFGEAPWGH